MELKGRDFDRIRREHLRGVQVRDFALVWLAAEQQLDELKGTGREDGYLTGVVWTCRWISNALVRFDEPINGRHGEPARPPISRIPRSAQEELIEAESRQAEAMAAAGCEWPDQPGYVAGVVATFAWTWRRSGHPPIQVASRLAG